MNDLNNSRTDIRGAGTQTAALAFGGSAPPLTGATEFWNGTNWTEINDLNTARDKLGGAGTNTSALAFGGEAPTITAATEEWNDPGTIFQTITTE